MWLLVVTLVLPALAVVFASLFLTVRAFSFFRQVGATGRIVGGEIERVAGSAEQAAAKAEALGRSAGEIESSLARLRASQAQLSVLVAAWSDVNESIGRVKAFVPRK